MTDRPAFLDRAWAVLSRWAVPVMMAMAYALLVLTSDAGRGGEVMMAVGLILVMIAWITFRRLTAAAALSRALSVGDAEALSTLADRNLARHRRPAARGRFLVARAFAQLLRGEHAAALATVDQIRGAPYQFPMAVLIDILARIELDQDEEVFFAAFGGLTVPGAPWLNWLVRGAVACHRGLPDGAAEPLARVIDDIRAGSALRAIAHVYAARVADARGDIATATRHRAAATSLAAPDAAWLRGEPRA